MDPSPYAEQRYKDGLEFARRATQYDQNGHFSAALSFYDEAVEALTQATSMAPVFNPILSQVGEYSKRANDIRLYLSSSKPNQGSNLVLLGFSVLVELRNDMRTLEPDLCVMIIKVSSSRGF